MFSGTGGRIAEITRGEILHYEHCIAKVMCNPPEQSCFMRTCKNCPGMEALVQYMTAAFEKYGNVEDECINFKQWLSVDRCSLESLTQTIPEFIDYFASKIEKLVTHSFVSRQQSQFIKDCKDKLKKGEFLISLDFSENFKFVIQNEAQGYHWNNESATIHPFVVYYKDANNDLQHLSYVVISDCLTHDSVAVHLFISKLIKFLKAKFPVINKLIYLTDGAASQYKCFKNFINLIHHKSDFGLDWEWHYHATSHGKGPCDGIGGTLKRKATKASLARPFQGQIQSAAMLF